MIRANEAFGSMSQANQIVNLRELGSRLIPSYAQCGEAVAPPVKQWHTRIEADARLC